MAKTYEPITSTTLGANAATITISSLPSTYTDLLVVTYLKATTNDVGCGIYFNSDNAGTSYGRDWVFGYSTTASSTRSTSASTIGNLAYNTGLSNTIFNVYKVNIMQYANTSINKHILYSVGNIQGTMSNTEVGIGVGLWRSTSAISSFTLTVGGGASFTTGSKVTVYGIKGA